MTTAEHPVKFASFDTRLGRCALAWSSAGVVSAHLPDVSQRALTRRVRERHEGAVESAPTESINAAISAVQSLFEGSDVASAHDALARVRLDLRAVPPFHAKVYALARRITPGDTRSYRALAEAAESPNAFRAVGQSMANNPFPVIVPCHRVLAADGKIGGFSAPGGVETKLRMLAIERDAVLRASSKARFAFDPTTAVEHLKTCDPALKSLIDRVGPFAMKLDPTPSVFTALAQAIAYQQLTGKAAETIWTRVCALFPYRPEGPAPELVLKASHEALRSAGLSNAKALSVRELAEKCVNKSVPSLEMLADLDDEDVIATLTSVRGIGRWTVEMLLMFRLGRGDVLPVDDYGVKKGFQKTFGGALPTKRAMIDRAVKWAPFRTVASWYLWRANELADDQGAP